jgi:hypothetical protein
MTITGTIRGDPAYYCVWTVKENKTSGAGTPPHFRVEVVLEHDEQFSTTLDVTAKVAHGWRPPKTLHIRTERAIDIGILKGKLDGEPEWRKDSTGEAPYASTQFSSAL